MALRRTHASALPGAGARPLSAVLAVAALTAILAACSPVPVPDPGLVALVEEATASARSAQLGLELDARGRILATTNRALLDGMAEELGDAVRELELHPADDPGDREYRAAALAAARAAVEGVHAAQNGDPDAGRDELTAAADELEHLGARG